MSSFWEKIPHNYQMILSLFDNIDNFWSSNSKEHLLKILENADSTLELQ